jgi:hypothetical protein
MYYEKKYPLNEVCMKYFFNDGLIIEIHSQYLGEEKLSETSPVTAYLKKKSFLREVSCATSCNKAIFKDWIKERKQQGKNTVKRAVDLMSGVGFGSKMIQKYLTPKQLYLNDMSPICVDVLIQNFPDAIITEMDANNYGWIEASIYTIDFNTFSFLHIDRWSSLFDGVCVHTDNFCIIDTACFGFFSKRNLKAYGIDKPLQYYEVLSDKFYDLYGFRVSRVSKFKNAAAVMFERNFNGEIKFLEPEMVNIKCYRKGLLF